MLSGSFHSIPLSRITVAPDRQRKELIGIEELAGSIRNIGQLHPIIITPEHQLVAGERRLRAHELLGLTHILCQFTNELSREELELIELEENVKRSQLDWREEATAAVRFHRLNLERDETWTVGLTADALAVSPHWVSRRILVVEEMEAGYGLVLEASSFTTAHNIAQRRRERAMDSVGEAIDSVLSSPISVGKIPPAGKGPGNSAEGARPSLTSAAVRDTASASDEVELPMPAPVEVVPYECIDFLEYATTTDDPPFNFIHCDFPYGISFNKHNMGATGTFGGYDDSIDAFERCMTALQAMLDRGRIAASAHIMFWFSARLDLLAPVLARLEAMGWTMNQVPLIWHRSDNAGILPDPERGPRQIYEVALFGSRGDRKIVQAVSNHFSCPKSKEIHASEKPRPMLQHFFRMFVDDSTVMLDPTMGSGNAVLVAESMGAKNVLGLEALPDFYANAVAHRRKVLSLSE